MTGPLDVNKIRTIVPVSGPNTTSNRSFVTNKAWDQHGQALVGMHFAYSHSHLRA